jgi:sterol 24-C-methyltransferase
MAPGHEMALARDMTFENIMHKKTATTHEGFSAMLNKDKEAQQAAVSEYFQHWDNKEAKNETQADREVGPAPSQTQAVIPHNATSRH